jgi:hypothetical protein
MEHQLETIRLVTERYRDLQGLRLVIAGAMLASTAGGLLMADARQRAVLIALIVTFIAMMPVLWLVDRYYTAKFGRTVGRPTPIAGWWLLGAMAVSATLTGKPLGPGQMASVFVIGAAAALWIAIRDWPLRAYHLLGCVSVAFGAAIQLLSLQSDFLPRAQAIAHLGLGLAYIPIGLLDHRLLTSVMRDRAGEPEVVRQE